MRRAANPRACVPFVVLRTFRARQATTLAALGSSSEALARPHSSTQRVVNAQDAAPGGGTPGHGYIGGDSRSIAQATYRATFYSCVAELRLNLTGGIVYWHPSPHELPARHQKRLLAQFRTWRNRCLREFARQHGRTVRLPLDRRDAVKLCRPGAAAEEIAATREFPIVWGHSGAPGHGCRA